MANPFAYDLSNMPMIVGDFKIQDFTVSSITYIEMDSASEDTVIMPDSGKGTARSDLRQRPMKITLETTGESFERTGFREFLDNYISQSESVGGKRGLDFAWTCTAEGNQYSTNYCLISRSYLNNSPYTIEGRIQVTLTLAYYTTEKI